MAKKTVVSFLLDETGSMQSIKDDTIGGFNSYLDALSDDSNQYEFTLVKFDSNKTEKVCVGVPIAEAPRLTSDNYIPGAATPLIDAAYKLIKATEKVVKKRKVNVLVVIQTDGFENASREHTRTDLAALIKEKTEKGWTFAYVGAGIDAFEEAGRLGISRGSTMSYKDSGETFTSLAINTKSFGATGMSASMNFTPKQRADSGDEYHGVHSGASKKKVARRKTSLVDDLDLTK